MMKINAESLGAVHTHTSSLKTKKAMLKIVVALLNMQKIKDSNKTPVIDTG